MFDLNMGKNYNDQVIPILRRERPGHQKRREELGHGDSTIWKVGIPKELVSPALRDKLKVWKERDNDTHHESTETV
jgi:hypothetical protein